MRFFQMKLNTKYVQLLTENVFNHCIQKNQKIENVKLTLTDNKLNQNSIKDQRLEMRNIYPL